MFRWAAIAFFFTACTTGKVATLTSEITAETTATEILKVRETITPPLDAAIFIPEVSGRIENFRQRISTPSGAFTVEKNDSGLTVKLEQKEQTQRDSIYTKSNETETHTTTSYKEVKKVVRWSGFQWFLLLFFIAILLYYIFKILRFLKFI